MLSTLLVAMFQASSVAPAPAPAPAVRPSVITNPDWIRRPTGADLAKYYPMQAARNEIEGFATIACNVAETGRLVGCTLVAEQPVGVGFGDAAIAMSSLFLMRPQTRDGQPVAGGTVRIPIRFGLPKEATTPIPSLTVASRCYGLAAAKLEEEPTAEDARLAFFGFRLLVELKLAGLKLRPSEVDSRLQSLRSEGEARFRNPDSSADRDKCRDLIGPFGGTGFQQMINEAADKP